MKKQGMGIDLSGIKVGDGVTVLFHSGGDTSVRRIAKVKRRLKRYFEIEPRPGATIEKWKYDGSRLERGASFSSSWASVVPYLPEHSERIRQQNRRADLLQFIGNIKMQSLDLIVLEAVAATLGWEAGK